MTPTLNGYFDDWRESQAGRFGALRHHVDHGLLSAQTLHAEIADIVTGKATGRTSDTERILFWHRGLSILDVALGWLILQRAEARDLGTMVRYR